MVSYCTLQQLFQLGPPAQAYAPTPRALENASASTGVLTLTGNGLFDTSLLRFVVQGSATPAQPSAALPQGLSTVLMYTAAPVAGSSDLFQVAPVGGSVITSFGDAGFGVFSIIVDPKPTLLAIIANESANVDNCLTGNAPPIKSDPITGLYPQVLVGVVARRTAVRGVVALGLANPDYRDTFRALREEQQFDNARLEEWLQGRQIKPEVIDQTAFADDAPRARSGPWMGRCYTPWIRRTL